MKNKMMLGIAVAALMCAGVAAGQTVYGENSWSGKTMRGMAERTLTYREK